MRTILSILAIILISLCTSCESETVENAGYTMKLSAPAAVAKHEVQSDAVEAVGEALGEKIMQSQNEDDANIIDRKIIKNGDVEFETSNIQSTRRQVLKEALKLNAYIANDEEFKYNGRITNAISLRVPSKKFEALLTATTEGVEKFDRKEIRAQDVTEEFIDLEARIKSKVELEIRYFELLNKAKNVKEMLEIETQLGELRTEIESMQGRLRYMKNSISYSTLNIKFYEDVPIANKFGKQFSQSFREGWDTLIGVFVSLIAVWPFLIIGILLLLFIRKKYKTKIRRKSV